MKRRMTQNGVLVEVDPDADPIVAEFVRAQAAMLDLAQAFSGIPSRLFHERGVSARSVQMQREEEKRSYEVESVRFYPAKQVNIDMVQDRDGRFVPRGHEDDCRKLR